jgi:hypothetical protein
MRRNNNRNMRSSSRGKSHRRIKNRWRRICRLKSRR